MNFLIMRVMHGFSASDCFSPIMKTRALSVNPLPPSQFQPRLIKKLRLHIIYIDKQSHCKWIQTFFFIRAFLGRGWMITFSLVPRPSADKRHICTICVLDYFASKNIDYRISELYIYLFFIKYHVIKFQPSSRLQTAKLLNKTFFLQK